MVVRSMIAFSWLLFFLFLILLVPVVLFADMEKARESMVREQIEARGVKNPLVLQAMKKVERHKFVPPLFRPLAYRDGPLPIGEDQTISQPYIVALMTELLDLSAEARVLEVGTGSGYQAAVLSEIVKEVYTIEIIPSLAESAAERLKELGYQNVFVRAGDGYLGWPERAPFDGIIVTAAPDEIPKPLLDQLKVGGKMVIPVGNYPDQTLYLVQKQEKGFNQQEVIPVRFVPMTGLAQEENKVDSQTRIG
ncbi:MAG: protein-L-isoaspartate(D-aspartate) O-methyltransferase [Candidatus Omnitrophica bacterium]|nr:protein-L-isoaspartate(D-aspartate) O-methyltransferase [Candidatus Omnitrophota bacterium]